MMSKILIFGAGGHGKVVADIATSCGYDEILFLDDRWPRIKKINNFKVIGNFETLKFEFKNNNVIVAVGDNQARMSIYKKLKKLDVQIPALIHQSSVVSESVKIGRGSVIMPGAILNSGCIVGENSIINTGAIIEHDCKIGDSVHISPSAVLCGSVTISDNVHIGASATVINNMSICANTVIGSGAVVVNNVVNQGLYKGVPAKFDNKL